MFTPAALLASDLASSIAGSFLDDCGILTANPDWALGMAVAERFR
jgi:hypothetical protein